jgi:hypothetical protein
MLAALDRDTPHIKKTGQTLPLDVTKDKITKAQEPPWLWFTLPELGFPLILDQYQSPIHSAVETFMKRYITDSQDWDTVDDEDC